jgi:chromosome partitioning protein
VLVVALTQTKGGSGKSTLAQNLAVRAAREGKAVVLVDLDPAQSAAKWWRRRGGPDNPILMTNVGSMTVFMTKLDVKAKPDVMILDTPGELLGRIKDAVSVADVIVVPIAPSIKDWEAMDSVESIIKAAGKLKRTVFVVNRYRTKATASTEIRRALQKRTGKLPHTVALATAHEKADADGKAGAETNGDIAGEFDLLWDEIKRIGKAHEQKANVPAA